MVDEAEINLAYLSLGSNIEPERNLPEAVAQLSRFGRIKAVSSVWQTAAVGYTEQADFLNGAVLLETTLSAKELRERVISQIEDILPGDVADATNGLPPSLRDLGQEALREGAVAVVSLAGGAGSRWTKGAGVVKAINPFVKLGGRHRNFIELHLAKSRQAGRLLGTPIPHIITTSYLTQAPIAETLARERNYDYPGPLLLSPGQIIGLRMIPMARDLRFAWEEMPQQLLDEQAQKVLDSLHNALIGWARGMGEGSDYTDNLPQQCLHPVGHWYEIPNLLRNGVLAHLLAERPQLQYLMVHNVDTLGVNVDPAILGLHIEQQAGLTTEVITRHLEDRGGGLARIEGHLRLIEGLALPREEIEFKLSYYNSSTTWVSIDQLLDLFGLTKEDLGDDRKVAMAVRRIEMKAVL